MSDLTKRLRGIYEIPVNDGAGPLGGKNTFTRTFDNMPPICIEAADRIEALEACLLELAAMTAAQAEDEGLWFNAMHASEGYLQQELRKLHAAIENKARALLEEK